MEEIPALAVWELIIDVFHPTKPKHDRAGHTAPNDRAGNTAHKPKNMYEELTSVDYVPTNLPEPTGRAILVLLEDNDPVIQICIKRPQPNTSARSAGA